MHDEREEGSTIKSAQDLIQNRSNWKKKKSFTLSRPRLEPTHVSFHKHTTPRHCKLNIEVVIEKTVVFQESTAKGAVYACIPTCD